MSERAGEKQEKSGRESRRERTASDVCERVRLSGAKGMHRKQSEALVVARQTPQSGLLSPRLFVAARRFAVSALERDGS